MVWAPWGSALCMHTDSSTAATTGMCMFFGCLITCLAHHHNGANTNQHYHDHCVVCACKLTQCNDENTCHIAKLHTCTCMRTCTHRDGNFMKQQQVAMKLLKAPGGDAHQYTWWVILSIMLQVSVCETV